MNRKKFEMLLESATGYNMERFDLIVKSLSDTEAQYKLVGVSVSCSSSVPFTTVSISELEERAEFNCSKGSTVSIEAYKSYKAM